MAPGRSVRVSACFVSVVCVSPGMFLQRNRRRGRGRRGNGSSISLGVNYLCSVMCLQWADKSKRAYESLSVAEGNMAWVIKSCCGAAYGKCHHCHGNPIV